MSRVPLIRPSFFVWVVIPLAMWLVYATFGLPHIRWSYEFHAKSYDPAAERYYTRCTFIGIYGSFTITPTNGTCDWFIMRKRKGAV